MEEVGKPSASGWPSLICVGALTGRRAGCPAAPAVRGTRSSNWNWAPNCQRELAARHAAIAEGNLSHRPVTGYTSDGPLRPRSDAPAEDAADAAQHPKVGRETFACLSSCARQGLFRDQAMMT